VNPNLAKLHPYPFDKLRLLFKDIMPNPRYPAIDLGIGEPKHATPEFIRQALTRNLSGLSKRSNVPGMRTGFVAGDAELMRAFLLYRTYHGSAMGLPRQAASVAAWATNKCGGKPPADGKYSLYCAVIVKRVDAKTRAKPVSMSCCAAIRHMRRAAELRARANHVLVRTKASGTKNAVMNSS
jgi:aspartate/methionine/tyrosine aminotransferase